ncbi:MAG: hypothetical protein ACRDIB_17085, partial [Ardenticatenaceae bacterium]
VSPAIVPDPWGRSYQRFEDGWLSEALQLPVSVAEQVGGSGDKYQLGFARGRVVDSFNNHIGLPRQRDIALAPGSAVTLKLKVNGSLSMVTLQQRLKEVERAGIGLRRGEGFGRVVFNHPMYAGIARDTIVDIPEPLQLKRQTGKTTQAREHRFVRDWSKYLDDKELAWREVCDEKFEGLLREIHTGWVRSSDDVKAMLDSYGKIEYLLGNDLPGRQKPSFYRKASKGKAGMKLLRELFAELAWRAGTGDDSRHLWRIGCRMMAERFNTVLREEAKRKGGGR